MYKPLLFLVQVINSASIGSNQPACEPLSNFPATFYRWYANSPKALEFINKCVKEWNCENNGVQGTTAHVDCDRRMYHCDFENPVYNNDGTVGYRVVERMCGFFYSESYELTTAASQLNKGVT